MNTFEFTNKTLFLKLYNSKWLLKDSFISSFHTNQKMCDTQTTTFNPLSTQTKYTALEPESKTNLILIKYIKCLNTGKQVLKVNF